MKPKNSNQLKHLNLLVECLNQFFKIGLNSKYKSENYSKRVIETCIKNTSFEEEHKKSKIISSDSILSYLHKLTFDKIQNLIEKINSKIKLKRKVILVIDFSDKVFYGDKNNSNTIGSKGGKQVLRFIQLSSCSPNYFLNSFKVNPFTNNKKLLLNALISNFKATFSKTKIDLVLLDRGFFSKEVVNYFCLNNLDFLMPAVKNKQIKSLISTFLEGKSPSKIKYKFGLNLVNLYFIKNDNDAYVFITNKNTTVSKICKLYKLRWNIETNFREQNNFTFKTKTLNFMIRYFNFVLGGLLMNLWKLYRLVLSGFESYLFKIEILNKIQNFQNSKGIG